MLSMSASGRLQNSSHTGIRPFDIGRDLRPVAELIAKAFASELDSRGAAALREMRIMGYMSGLLRLLNQSTGEFDDVFNGFVWIEDGKVVGNITVQRGDSYGNRWQIANVAVEPTYRGRGIARQLLQRALQHIEGGHGRWAVLQVYENNLIARNLYEKLGFENMGGEVEMRLGRVPEVEIPAELPYFREFTSADWKAHFELANSQSTAQAQWWRSLRRSDYQITFEQQFGEWLSQTVGRNRVYRRAIQFTDRFEAALVMEAKRWRGDHKLKLWVRPEQYGSYEELMVQWALAQLQDYPRNPISVRLNTHHQEALRAFRRYGFHQCHALLTMRRKIREGV